MTKENDTAMTKEKDDSQASTGKEVSKSAERQYSEIVKETNHRQEEMGNKTKDSMNNTSQSPKERQENKATLRRCRLWVHPTLSMYHSNILPEQSSIYQRNKVHS